MTAPLLAKPQGQPLQALVISGLAREARIAAGPGVLVVCSGSCRIRLRDHLAGLGSPAFSSVISFGIAGGLDPQLRPGDVVIATGVRAGGDFWPVPPKLIAGLAACMEAGGTEPVRGVIAGADAAVLHPQAKADLREATGAIAVDMESHVAAAYAAANGLPFAALRVISDSADQALPSVASRAVRADGRVDLSAVFAGLVRDPFQLLALIRTGRDAGTAFAALGRCRLRHLGVGFGLADV